MVRWFRQAIRALNRGRRRSLTVVLVPSTNGTAKSVSVTVLGLYASLGALCALLLFLAVSYIVMASSMVDIRQIHERKETEITTLTQERDELLGLSVSQQREIEVLSERVNTLEEHIEALDELGEEIRSLLSGEVSDIDLTAVGSMSTASASGPSELRLAATYTQTGGPSEASANAIDLARFSSARAVELMERISMDEQALAELRDDVADYRHQLDHRPSIWPVRGRISSPYGTRIHPISRVRSFHHGVDIAVGMRTPVKATADGVVSLSRWYGGYGYTVMIDHGYGLETLYAHNDSLMVREGERVARGQIIAYSGSTGNSTGPHLHYEVRKNGSSVDPMPYMRD